MYKRALYSVCNGAFCHSVKTDGGVLLFTREGGKTVRRQIALPSGKVFGARAVSYADAYFEFVDSTVEILGEEIIYDVKTREN